MLNFVTICYIHCKIERWAVKLVKHALASDNSLINASTIETTMHDNQTESEDTC